MTSAVVTGLGCVSAIGDTAHEFWQKLLAGTSGIKEISAFSHAGLRNRLAGEVRLTAGLRDLAASTGTSFRLHLFAFSAIDEALADSGLDLASIRRNGGKAALVVGTSLGMSLIGGDSDTDVPTELEGDEFNARLADLGAALERRYGLEDRVTIVSTACASGTHAIALGLDMIRHEGYQVVIAGGVDTLDRMKYLGHSALATLTTGQPRPFSYRRDGTLFGEGAGFLVLQAPDRPITKHYALCLGGGYSNDINHVTAPDPQGVGGSMAIRAALADAGIAPEAIGHINLHGSGTALNDSAEYAALEAVFGQRIKNLPCTSIKAAVGHCMGAAGGIEAIATVLSIRHASVPPTVNVAAHEVEFPIDLVVEEVRRSPIEYALSNSFGFGGANGSLVFSH